MIKTAGGKYLILRPDLTITGTTGSGKTTAALRDYLFLDEPALFISGEMRKTDVDYLLRRELRILSDKGMTHAHDNNKHFFHYFEFEEEVFQKIIDSIEKNRYHTVYVDYIQAFTDKEIEMLRRACMKHNSRIVCTMQQNILGDFNDC